MWYKAGYHGDRDRSPEGVGVWVRETECRRERTGEVVPIEWACLREVGGAGAVADDAVY